MEMKRIAAIFLFLISHMKIGMPRRCYLGLHGRATLESVCQGTCLSVKTGASVALSCNNFITGSGCMTVGSALMCLCNEDLCNDGSLPEPKTSGVPLKCYKGFQGPSIQETECKGSCMKVRTSQNGVTIDYFGCIPSTWSNICLKFYGYTSCLCDTNLCNRTIPVLPGAPTGPTNPSSGGLSGFPIPGMGKALKCYFGKEGGKVTEVDCGGSCMAYETTNNGQKATFYECSPFRREETCETAGPVKACACNRNLCNQSGKSTGNSPTGNSPTGHSKSGNFQTGSSLTGNSAMRTHLSIIYMVICSAVTKALVSA